MLHREICTHTHCVPRTTYRLQSKLAWWVTQVCDVFVRTVMVRNESCMHVIGLSFACCQRFAQRVRTECRCRQNVPHGSLRGTSVCDAVAPSVRDCGSTARRLAEAPAVQHKRLHAHPNAHACMQTHWCMRDRGVLQIRPRLRGNAGRELHGEDHLHSHSRRMCAVRWLCAHSCGACTTARASLHCRWLCAPSCRCP